MTTTRKRNLLKWLAIALLPLGFILYLLWSQLFIHDWYLWRFSRSFSQVTPPPATRHLKSYRKLGLLIANGNHIDLFAGELRSYTGARQDVIDWYAKKSIPSQLAPEERVPVEVVFVENGKLSSGKIGFDRPYIFSNIIDDTKGRTSPDIYLYVVYALDATAYDPGVDIRGM